MHEHRAYIDELRASVQVARRKLAPGQHLYRAGQVFRALFVVDAGLVKTCELARDGREQVTGFRMCGDWIGLESIGLERCRCDAIALDASYAWELPYGQTINACRESPALQARFNEALAREIRSDWLWMLALGTLGAENRVAAFLLDFAERHARFGANPTHLMLPMRRIDMANYLALKHETVSRALSRLEHAGVIAVRGRGVRIVDVRGLSRVAHSNQLDPAAASVSAGRTPDRRVCKRA